MAPYINIFDPTGRLESWNAYKHDITRHGADITPHDERARGHWAAHWGCAPRRPLVAIAPGVARLPDNSEQPSAELQPETEREMYLTIGGLPCHDDCFFVDIEGVPGPCPLAVYGGSVPDLLRPVDSALTNSACYEFVGECFLQGHMDGNVLDQRLTNVPSEVFIFI